MHADTAPAQTLCEPAIAVNWRPAAAWHEEPAAAPLPETCPLEVDVPAPAPADGDPGDGPHPMRIIEPAAESVPIEVGTMILLERDRHAAGRNGAEPMRFARVDHVGTARGGQRRLHVRWFRTRDADGRRRLEAAAPPFPLTR